MGKMAHSFIKSYMRTSINQSKKEILCSPPRYVRYTYCCPGSLGYNFLVHGYKPPPLVAVTFPFLATPSIVDFVANIDRAVKMGRALPLQSTRAMGVWRGSELVLLTLAGATWYRGKQDGRATVGKPICPLSGQGGPLSHWLPTAEWPGRGEQSRLLAHVLVSEVSRIPPVPGAEEEGERLEIGAYWDKHVGQEAACPHHSGCLSFCRLHPPPQVEAEETGILFLWGSPSFSISSLPIEFTQSISS